MEAWWLTVVLENLGQVSWYEKFPTTWWYFQDKTKFKKNLLCESCLCKRLNSPWTAAGQRGNMLVYGPSGGTRNEAIDRVRGSCRAEHSLFFPTLVSAFLPGLSSFPFSVDCLPLQGKQHYSLHFLSPTLGSILQHQWGVHWCFLWRKDTVFRRRIGTSQTE